MIQTPAETLQSEKKYCCSWLDFYLDFRLQTSLYHCGSQPSQIGQQALNVHERRNFTNFSYLSFTKGKSEQT